MFEKGLKLKISGGPFESDVRKEFELLKDIKGTSKKNMYSSLIYGRNGSGKTTICNALDEIKLTEVERTLNVSLVDTNDDEYTDVTNNIFVYSEKFIDENIRFKSEGLETIVLLGDNLSIDDKIKDLKENIIKKRGELDSYDLSIYDDNKNPLNPQSSWNRILSTLKMEGNWATRKRQISSLTRNPSVNENVIKDIISNHDCKTTLENFNRLLNDFLRVKENNYVCEYKIKNLPEITSINSIEKLLNKALEKKDNDQLALEIYDVIDRYGNSRIGEISDTLESDIEYCPYCFQKLDKKYKEQIIEKIKNVISKEEDELRNAIDGSIIQEYFFDDLPDFIPDNEKLKLEKNVKSYNREVILINRSLLDKKDKLYTQVNLPKNKIIETHFELQQSLNEITSIINKHNEDIQKIKLLEKELFNYNNALSWETIEDEYNTYQHNLSLKVKNEKAAKEIKKDIIKFEDEIRELEGEKKNIGDAIKEINNGLSYIFMSKERLQIRNEGNDKYVVLSRGKPIEANDLSTGERNIIAMCYFFSCIGKGKNAKNRFKDEYIICIDDPISSFDYDNKVGIYSYLRQSIYRILKGNINTRFILLTHNYEVAYNLDKILRDIYDEILGSKNAILTLNLQEFNLFEEKNLQGGANQYKKLLENIFLFANEGESEITDLTIGNSVRRVLETFASFEFNKSMEFLNRKITTTNENLSIDQLKNYMYRVLVNNESHGMLSAYAYDEVDRFEMFTPEEKRNTAKLALILLKLLNESHVDAYLGDKVKKIEEWESNYSYLIK